MSRVGEKTHSFSKGFSFVEMLIVVVILAVLTVASAAMLDSALIATTKASRDIQRKSDMEAVATKLEQYYRANPTVNGSSYPTTTTMASSAASIITEDELRTPPGLDSPVFLTASTNAAQTPTVDEYVYQPLNRFDALCSDATAPCVRFLLYYTREADNQTITVESSHQQ